MSSSSSSSSSSRTPSGQEGHGSASRSQAPPASPSAPPPPLNNAIDNANANANVDDDQEQHNRQLRMRVVAQAYLDRVLEGDAQAKDKEEAAAAKKAREEDDDAAAVRASGLLVDDELEQVKGELADSYSTNATLSAEVWASQNRILALEAEVRGANAPAQRRPRAELKEARVRRTPTSLLIWRGAAEWLLKDRDARIEALKAKLTRLAIKQSRAEAVVARRNTASFDFLSSDDLAITLFVLDETRAAAVHFVATHRKLMTRILPVVCAFLVWVVAVSLMYFSVRGA
ncbi:uncharacterized protein LTHEOB_11343 [Lasiodiplodia theobromae]|uniref:uncharacterized protein n=1 Tax=Lasiodiplodia theobromae TaxID=45133 RepID=UPI0015C3C324|nr:uncharacterized protein LTHEOB_11343 [Lasiodiplodia theobromae]KAF4537859.1 hypothetical protein LTHEOB_11343 [Lasiodiplodia theobromae]